MSYQAAVLILGALAVLVASTPLFYNHGNRRAILIKQQHPSWYKYGQWSRELQQRDKFLHDPFTSRLVSQTTQDENESDGTNEIDADNTDDHEDNDIQLQFRGGGAKLKVRRKHKRKRQRRSTSRQTSSRQTYPPQRYSNSPLNRQTVDTKQRSALSRTEESQPSSSSASSSKPFEPIKVLTNLGKDAFHTYVHPILLDPEEFFFNQTFEAQQRREFYQERSLRTVATIMFLPSRIIQICLISWFVSETISLMGIGESVVATKVRKLKAIPNLLDRALDAVQRFFVQSRPDRFAKRIQNWKAKHQWAVGAALGLILSPAVWPLGRQAVKLSVLAYIVGEINFHINELSGQNERYRYQYRTTRERSLTGFRRKRQRWTVRLGVAVEQWRKTVRAIVMDPWRAAKAIRDNLDVQLTWMENLLEGLPPHVLQGFIGGTIIGLFTAI